MTTGRLAWTDLVLPPEAVLSSCPECSALVPNWREARLNHDRWHGSPPGQMVVVVVAKLEAIKAGAERPEIYELAESARAYLMNWASTRYGSGEA